MSHGDVILDHELNFCDIALHCSNPQHEVSNRISNEHLWRQLMHSSLKRVYWSGTKPCLFTYPSFNLNTMRHLQVSSPFLSSIALYRTPSTWCPLAGAEDKPFADKRMYALAGEVIASNEYILGQSACHQSSRATWPWSNNSNCLRDSTRFGGAAIDSSWWLVTSAGSNYGHNGRQHHVSCQRSPQHCSRLLKNGVIGGNLTI